MKKLFAKSIQGKCSICDCELKNGGYLYFKHDTLERTLCPTCDEFKLETKDKPKKLKVKKYYGFMKRGFYEVIRVTNLISSKGYISEKELNKIIETRPDIEVEIIY